MSGICGIFNFQKQEPVLSTEIKQMLNALRHRGVGKIGLYLYKNIGLGVQQTMSESESDRQPLASADENIWVMFDGEIQNYQQLRKLPRLRKYRWFSNSPAELLLNLYLEFREAGVELLRGAFSCAIWDNLEKKLLLARDPLGLRNLYYTEMDGRIFFASEMKALLQDTRIPRSLDVRAVNQFLHHGFVLAPDTVLARVKKIAAGHWVTFSAQEIQVKRYWEYQPKAEENAGIEYFKSKLLNAFEAAISAAVPNENPVGVLLSGGLDSALLVALLRQCCRNELLTFNLRMDSSEPDGAAQQAQLIHQRFGTRHFELTTSPEDFLQHFDRAVWYQDEPVADPALVAQFQLYQFVKLNLDTVLSAEGLDELLGGKACYLKASQILHPYYFTHSEYQTDSKTGCRRLPRVRHWSKNYPAKNGAISMPDRNQFDEQKLYSSQFWLKLKSLEELPVNGRKVPKGALDKLFYFEINDILPDRALLKNDRLSTAISLKTRLPFYNQALVDLSARIPVNLKINQTHTKYILRMLAQDFLPESVVWQRRRGWQVPVDPWLHGALKNWPAEVLLNSKHFERGLFNPERLRQLLAAQAAGETHAARFIYALIYLETWFALFLDERQMVENEPVSHASFY
jgi:asparagine synthase (glutamine-hydrolysing)